jgi:hypothetical protein
MKTEVSCLIIVSVQDSGFIAPPLEILENPAFLF